MASKRYTIPLVTSLHISLFILQLTLPKKPRSIRGQLKSHLRKIILLVFRILLTLNHDLALFLTIKMTADTSVVQMS